MNVESTIVLFDSIAARKKLLGDRIEACYACLDLMVGNERIGTEAELKCYLDEREFIAKLQLDFMRAIYNGGK
jgi:hypothetical protein